MSIAKASQSTPYTLFESRTCALAVGLLILLIDGLTKALIHFNLPLYSEIQRQSFLGIDFALTHATNRGAAWGILAGFQWPLLAIRMALVGGLILYFLSSERHPAWRIPLALVIAGALGNILDAFIYGHVVDMFHFIFWGYDYPVFNVADSSIFVGIGALLIASWFEKK